MRSETKASYNGEVGFTNSAHGFHSGRQVLRTRDDESAPLAGLVREMRVMLQEGPRRDDPIRPLDWYNNLPFEAAAASDRLGWVGLVAARYREPPASEINLSPLTHHTLARIIHAPNTEKSLGSCKGLKP